jgi:hypothetical protein
MIRSVFFILAIITLSAVAGHAQLLGTACEPYGSISIDGEPVADNITVTAHIDGIEFARCTTLSGQYAMIVAKDNPDTDEKEGWSHGDIIVIHVNGTAASPSLTAQQGRVRHDISLFALSVKLDTWGKIKALFK